MIAYAHGADLIGAIGLLAVSAVLGLVCVRARHRQVELERGRRTYPCSHGAAGRDRWPADPRA